MTYHNNKNVFIVIRSKRLPETVSCFHKSQDSRDAELLTQHFVRAPEANMRRTQEKKKLVCPLAKAARRSRGREKSWLSKNPSRHVGSKYMLLSSWGVGGGLDHGYLFLTLLLVNSNSSFRCCNTGRPSAIFRQSDLSSRETKRRYVYKKKKEIFKTPQFFLSLYINSKNISPFVADSNEC